MHEHNHTHEHGPWSQAYNAATSCTSVSSTSNHDLIIACFYKTTLIRPPLPSTRTIINQHGHIPDQWCYANYRWRSPDPDGAFSYIPPFGQQIGDTSVRPPITEVRAQIANAMRGGINNPPAASASDAEEQEDDSDDEEEAEDDLQDTIQELDDEELQRLIMQQKQLDQAEELARREEEDNLNAEIDEVDAFYDDDDESLDGANDNEDALFVDADHVSDDEDSTATGKKRRRSKIDSGPVKKRGRPKGSKNKAKKTEVNAPFDPSHILGANAAKDYAGVAHLPSQPKWNASKTRQEGLRQLLLSIPIADQTAARSDAVCLDEAMRKFDGKPFAPGNYAEDGALMRGMRTHMKHFQIVAVGWMRSQETRPNGPRGGIVAHEMGLGKTLMALANIVNGQISMKRINAARRQARYTKLLPRPTLIIVPASVLTQWKTELCKHVHYNPHTSLRSLNAEQKSGLTKVTDWQTVKAQAKNAEDQVRMMQNQDIVFATYAAVRNSFPKMAPPPELVTSRQKQEWFKKHYAENKGPLHTVQWQRIVLDEAHTIKNHRSQIFKACRFLEAFYRWALTGTPVQNSLDEFYPYFKFLREQTIKSMRHWTVNFSSEDDEKDDSMTNKRILALLTKWMIRKTHGDTMFNAKLLDIPLPAKDINLYINQLPIEKVMYRLCNGRAIRKINAMCRQDQTQVVYRNVLTLLLRLRQATCHPLLLLDFLLDTGDRVDLERLRKATSMVEDRVDGVQAMIQLRHMLNGINHEDSSQDQSCIVATQGDDSLEDLRAVMPEFDAQLGNVHGSRGSDYIKYIDIISKGTDYVGLAKKTKCAYCSQEPDDAYITNCKHIYCRTCLEDIMERALRSGKDIRHCSDCKEVILHTEKCFEAQPAEGSSEQAATVHDDTARPLLPTKKGTKKNKWLKVAGAVGPSIKTMAMKTQVIKWKEEEPDRKIIIFSQWTQFLSILKQVCEGERWQFRMYQGNMTQKARDAAKADFEDPEKDVTILLTSLTCGGLGLNLTAASRVLIMDSWWNDSVEHQAFCRVFRYGQEKQTQLVRLVVRNTVDEGMMQLKERKSIEINAIMNEDSDKKPTLSELMECFGKTGVDGNGKPFIFPLDDGFGDDEFDAEMNMEMEP